MHEQSSGGVFLWRYCCSFSWSQRPGGVGFLYVYECYKNNKRAAESVGSTGGTWTFFKTSAQCSVSNFASHKPSLKLRLGGNWPILNSIKASYVFKKRSYRRSTLVLKHISLTFDGDCVGLEAQSLLVILPDNQELRYTSTPG